MLGALYGRGVPSIAEQLRCSVEKAQEIKDSVFRGFPAIKDFEQASLNMAQTLGYVTTVCGRKRRLPELQLDEFEFVWQDGYIPEGDILDFDDIVEDIPQNRINYYWNKLKKCKFSEKDRIKAEALEKDHIKIIDNGGKIADATRQCVNARIQGRRSTNCPYSFNPITQGCT